MIPVPPRARKLTRARWTPWRRLADYRRRFEDIVDRLIDDVAKDANSEFRDDVLAGLLRSRFDDGSTMSRKEIGDELLTLLTTGHETVAATLSWVFERISRHTIVLANLVEEAETDSNEYRQATLAETQRIRTILDITGRKVHAPIFELGSWLLPYGTTIIIGIDQLHARRQDFTAPEQFRPERFIGNANSKYAWMPYGGGTRRCVGSVFANVEMDTVLATVSRNCAIQTTKSPGEARRSRGLTAVPRDGGRITVQRVSSGVAAPVEFIRFTGLTASLTPMRSVGRRRVATPTLFRSSHNRSSMHF